MINTFNFRCDQVWANEIYTFLFDICMAHAFQYIRVKFQTDSYFFSTVLLMSITYKGLTI